MLNSVLIKNISLSTHDSFGRSHIEFVDQLGNKRLGRILSGDTPVEHLGSLYASVRDISRIILPDGISKLPDGCLCLSLNSQKFSPVTSGVLTLPELIKPLKLLHAAGMNHLSIDEHSLVMVNGISSLIFWGDGLLSIHPGAPCEVKSGGIPGDISDLYMLATTALKMNWLSEQAELQDAQELCNKNVTKRMEAADTFGYTQDAVLNTIPTVPKPGVNIIQGGTWQARDLYVNQLTSIAATKGWVCRVIRCAQGERERPLPDMPAGTVTNSPEELMENAFAGQGGIEKLLIIHDLIASQEDFTALLTEMSRLIPSGLRLVLCGSSIPKSFTGNRIFLEGPITSAVDLPFLEAPENTKARSVGSSWYGPRVRISAESALNRLKPAFSREILFEEGAWRYTASTPGDGKNDRKAESFFILGKFTEALKFVSKQNHSLRSRILMALGRYDEASHLLIKTNEFVLLAEAYLGQGEVNNALDVFKNCSDLKALPLMARLHDLSGSPASALQPLQNGLKKAAGGEKVNIYCALRSIEMRLGMYEDALKHAEAAVSLARKLASVSHLVKSLQERGRTLQVAGNWMSAIEDFRTAAQFHDESILSFKRPPHIDLFVLQLKMGRMTAADKTLEKMKKLMKTGGIPAQQMLNMLEAYRGVLLGSGEKSLPQALRAAELADKHGLELYSGLSTLYAGQLYIQSGDIQRGIELLRKARSIGHVLGDRHLVCLAEVELLLEHETGEFTETAINEMAIALPEELAAAQIISGVNRDSGFEILLELPSPLLACRLADKCGFPTNSKLRQRIFQSRDDTGKQLNSKERADYNNQFNTKWSLDSDETNSQWNNNNFLSIISNWIQSYLEGESVLTDLAKALDIDELSITKNHGMTPVPGNNPLYYRGSSAGKMARFLEPIASVLAAGPVEKVIPRTQKRKDKLSDTIIGDSMEMRRIRFELERVATENVPVLISGETGTGKELCARAIHFGSQRGQCNFVPVDCGAIPEALMESEFFGAARGAYTGVNFPRKGLLEEADRGTLFLDEIGNLPLHMQAKLLRVLDTGVFRRLGETRERTTDLRLVAATNSDVDKQIAKGSFRTDLYYRISVVRIDLPPLRERLEDIPMLVAHFTEKSITGGALNLLSRYRWPGNIRELSNVLKRASITSAGNIIQKNHISFNAFAKDSSDTCTLQDAIRRHIRETVDAFGGSRSKAAKVLQCDPKTLRKYLTE